MRRFRIVLSVCLAMMLGGASALAGEAVGAGAARRAGNFTLRLGGFAFDPLQGEPQLPAGWGRSASHVPDLHLIQFDGPISAGALEALREAGLEPVQYIPPNTYIVWGLAADRIGLQHERAVRWTGDFAPAYRVQPQWRNLESEALEIKALVYRGADADAVIEAVSRLGGELTARLTVNDKFEIAGFRLPGDRMQAAAAIPGVCSIQLQADDGGSRAEVSAQINASNVDFSNRAYPGYESWLAGLGLNGDGVIVAGVDEGVDETHPDLAARMAPCTGESCSTTPSIHGTHTAGIIVGDGSSGVLDSHAFLRGLGVAPGARLVEQEYYPLMAQSGGILRLMTDSYKNGASVSNNSWGSSAAARGYDMDTMLVDIGVRDADPEYPGNQPLIYIQAIDNGQGGTSTQGAPDEAKNIFTIGATKAIGSDGAPDPNINDLAYVSAHGPALDGRTIPHIVAPGCRVDSTYPDLGQGHQHNTRCGTSQAAPQVSGAVALFIEYYRNLPGYTVDPSPALVKAAFMPVARDLAGFHDADGVVMGHRPDSKQGWGRLDLAPVINPPAGSVIYYDQQRIFEETGKEWLRTVTPINPSKPMRVMLVWTDAPGHGLGGDTPAWNNDLDLVVEAGAATYYGNHFGADGFSTTGGAPDGMNNAEGVFLRFPPADVTIRVLATNINSDGVPNFDDETDQDFALVCYNCAFTPGFALTLDPVTVDVCSPNDATYRVHVEQHSGYQELVTLSTADEPPGAVVTFDINPVAPGGSSLLTIDPGSAVAGDYEIQLYGDSVDLHRSHAPHMRLRTAAPAAAILTSPSNGAVAVFPQPVLQWGPVSWAARYVVEVATDPQFNDLIYTALSKGTSHTIRQALAQETLYYWRVRATNVCGFGPFSAVWSFTTQDVAPLMLVDEHDESWDPPDVQSAYTSALDALAVNYDIWDVWASLGREPDYATLVHYDRVLWFSGREEIYAGPSEAAEGDLQTWFRQKSGCLLITSRDYVLNSDFSPFIQEWLGVASVVEDTGQNSVTGQGSVFGGLGPYTLKNANPDYADSLTPDATAEIAFSGNQGSAGVDKNGGYYRTSFMGYGMERLSDAAMQNVLSAFFGWCDGLSTVDGDLDGVINGEDCAPGDPGAWTAPSPVTDLMVSKEGASEFSWNEPLSGSGSVYDVIRSLDPTDFWNATCVASGVAGPPSWGDSNPSPGQAFFYQVRGRNACGMSSLGENPDGTPRHGTACK